MSFLTSLGRRLHAAWPGRSAILAGAPLWGGVLAVSATIGLYWRMRLQTSHLMPLVAVYFGGGLLAWPAGLYVLRLLVPNGSLTKRYFVAVILLGGSTIAVAGLLFALVYRNFYAQWHGEPFTLLWVLQFVVTMIVALYQFAVLGVPLLLPAGLPVLFLAALAAERLTR